MQEPFDAIVIGSSELRKSRSRGGRRAGVAKPSTPTTISSPGRSGRGGAGRDPRHERQRAADRQGGADQAREREPRATLGEAPHRRALRQRWQDRGSRSLRGLRSLRTGCFYGAKKTQNYLAEVYLGQSFFEVGRGEEALASAARTLGREAASGNAVFAAHQSLARAALHKGAARRGPRTAGGRSRGDRWGPALRALRSRFMVDGRRSSRRRGRRRGAR